MINPLGFGVLIVALALCAIGLWALGYRFPNPPAVTPGPGNLRSIPRDFTTENGFRIAA